MVKTLVTTYKSGKNLMITLPINLIEAEEIEHRDILEIEVKNTKKKKELKYKTAKVKEDQELEDELETWMKLDINKMIQAKDDELEDSIKKLKEAYEELGKEKDAEIVIKKALEARKKLR